MRGYRWFAEQTYERGLLILSGWFFLIGGCRPRMSTHAREGEEVGLGEYYNRRVLRSCLNHLEFFWKARSRICPIFQDVRVQFTLKSSVIVIASLEHDALHGAKMSPRMSTHAGRRRSCGPCSDHLSQRFGAIRRASFGKGAGQISGCKMPATTSTARTLAGVQRENKCVASVAQTRL